MRLRLPIPFLILILAGIVCLGSFMAGLSFCTRSGCNRAAQIQTVEQERMVAFYLQFLTWMTDISSKYYDVNPQPPGTHSRLLTAPTPKPFLPRAS
jgi:hypothetical protein